MELLKKINKFLRKFEIIVISYSIIGMAFLTIADVLSRNLLNHSLNFAQELNQFLIVFVTFLGTSYAARNGRHIRMSAISDLASKKIEKPMAYIMSAGTSLILFYLTYLSGKYVYRVFNRGRVSSVLTIPLHYIWVWVPIGLLLAAIQYALAFIKNVQEDDVWLSFEEKSEYADVEDVIAGEDSGCLRNQSDL